MAHRQVTTPFLAVLLLTACAEDSTPIDTAQNTTPDPADAGEHDAGKEPKAVYALHTGVTQLDGTNIGYVTLMNSLDVSGELSLSGAREFPGYAFITPVNGKLLVSDGEAPTVTQFEISDDLDWKETATLGFSAHGSWPYGASFERHWFLDEHAAYLTLDVTSRVVWDPTNFEIIGVKHDTALEMERGDFVLDAAFNRPPRILKGPVLKPYFYRDADWFEFGPVTPIAVYDKETHEEDYIVEVPCPAVEVSSQDEEGNTYFSPWTYGPALGLFGEGPDTCIRRLTNEGQLDEEWAPDLREWTDGRPVQVFRYLKDGKALGTVLHLDEVEGDFDSGYNEELAWELDTHWRLWMFDLEAETAEPVEGVANSSMGFSMDTIDDRTFVFLPNEDWSATTIYELGLDGKATERFTVAGIVSRWVRVR